MSVRITFFFNIQYPASSKFLAVVIKNFSISRGGGSLDTSKSSAIGGIDVSLSSDSGVSKGIVATTFPEMPNLFRIRRDGFEKIKVSHDSCFLFVLYVQCVYGRIW